VSMDEKDVPQAWIDAAMVGASPGCRDDARAYLAKARDTMFQDFLWGILDEDPWVRCACGQMWEVLVSQGPDAGHGRTKCPAAADASVTVGGVTLWLYEWRLMRYADQAGQSGWHGITGRVRNYERGLHVPEGPLEDTYLPSYFYSPAQGQRVQVEISYDGIRKDPFLSMKWHSRS